MNRHEKLLAKV